MKKARKVLGALLAICLLAGLLPLSALAANGPSQEQEEGWYFAYVSFFALDEEGYVEQEYEVYADREVKNEMDGAVYDLATNTLTITDLKNDALLLETNAMGDDFTLCVVGECELGAIRVYGWYHGGGLTITGTGTLTVNEQKNFDAGLILCPEGADVILDFGRDVTVNLYGAESPLKVEDADLPEGGITLSNGQTLVLTGAPRTEEDYSYLIVFSTDEDITEFLGYRAQNSEDPDGIYTLSPFVYEYEDGHEEAGYDVMRFVYSEQYGCYFIDLEFLYANMDENGYIELMEEDYANSPFTILLDQNQEPIPFEERVPTVLQAIWLEDEAGERYVYTEDQTVGAVAPVSDLGTDEVVFYVFDPMSPDDLGELTPVLQTYVYDDVIDYTFEPETLTYDPENGLDGAGALDPEEPSDATPTDVTPSDATPSDVTPSDADGDDFLRGDINEDGKVDASDALMALKAAVGKIELTARQTLIGDMDEDGGVTASDALAILKIAVGKAA